MHVHRFCRPQKWVSAVSQKRRGGKALCRVVATVENAKSHASTVRPSEKKLLGRSCDKKAAKKFRTNDSPADLNKADKLLTKKPESPEADKFPNLSEGLSGHHWVMYTDVSQITHSPKSFADLSGTRKDVLLWAAERYLPEPLYQELLGVALNPDNEALAPTQVRDALIEKTIIPLLDQQIRALGGYEQYRGLGKMAHRPVRAWGIVCLADMFSSKKIDGPEGAGHQAAETTRSTAAPTSAPSGKKGDRPLQGSTSESLFSQHRNPFKR